MEASERRLASALARVDDGLDLGIQVEPDEYNPDRTEVFVKYLPGFPSYAEGRVAPAAVAADYFDDAGAYETSSHLQCLTSRLGIVKDIVVDAGLRGRGIGRRLLHALLRALFSLGAESVLLYADPAPGGLDQHALIAFYESFGFALAATDRHRNVMILSSRAWQRQSQGQPSDADGPASERAWRARSNPRRKGAPGAGSAREAPLLGDLSALPDRPGTVVFRAWHATRRDRAESILRDGFRPSRFGDQNFFGPGIYLATDLRWAAAWLSGDAVLLSVVARVERPLVGVDRLGPLTAYDDAARKIPKAVWDHQDQRADSGDRLGAAAREAGYDAILIQERSEDDGGNQACLFRPDSVLSVTRASEVDVAEARRIAASRSQEDAEDTRSNPPHSLSLWHATPHRFDVFDPDRSGLGTHFGTRRAAAFRMRHAGGLQGNRAAWSLDRYLVAARKPLRLRDTGDWTTEAGTEGALIAAGVLSPSDLPEARRHSGADFWRWARRRIEDAGYDSVVYTNSGEDAGSDSYVIWNHDQIRRAPTRPARVSNPPPARRRVPRTHPRIDLIRRVVASVRSGSDGPHGLRSIGYGTQREVFELSPDEVLKVEHRPDDSDENLHENEAETLAWEGASDEQARYLCPVLAAGDGWIVMRRAEDFDPGSPHDEREWEPLERISPADACELNVGRIDGRLVLVDYGR